MRSIHIHISLLCLHMAYIITIVDIINIIAIANTNMSMIKLLVKKFLLANSVSNSSLSCLSFKSKISF